MRINLDYHNILFMYLLKDSDEVVEIREEIIKPIINIYLKFHQHKSPMKDLEAIEFLNNFQNRIEKEIAKLVSKKSIYYWFHLYRRIGVCQSFKEKSTTTTWLYRNMLECAFAKYGKEKPGKELVFGNRNKKVSDERIASGKYKRACEFFMKEAYTPKKREGIFLGEFNIDSYMEIYQLERLAYEYWYTTSCKRRLYKGGSLIIDGNEYSVINDDETDSLISYYDTRTKDSQDITSTSGIILENSGNESNGVMFIPQYNVNRFSTKDYPYQQLFNLSPDLKDINKKYFVPNFVWFPFDFNYYYKVHEFLKEKFFKKYGYSLECFVKTLYLVVKQAVVFTISSSGVSGIDLMNRAYRHIKSKKKYIDLIVDMSEKEIILGMSKHLLEFDEVDRVLKNLEYNDDSINISLTTIGPKKLIISSIDGGFILDYASIFSILISHMHFLDADDSTKGHMFEDAVIEKMKKYKAQFWECKKQLKHSDKTSKEIDVSFYYKNILFIGELKCNKMSMSFIEGNFKSLEFRKKKILKAVEQSEQKVEWLIKHPQGTNYTLPKHIDVIIPIVVTPFNEYIWSRNQNLWINDEISRICMPSDLEKLCTDDAIKNIVNLPYARFVKH